VIHSLRLFLAVLVLSCAGPAFAESRIALVIGNSNYGAVSALANPTRDAELMSQTLTDLGFEVTTLIDSDQIMMKRGITQFGRALRDAGADATGLFYYAGHGVQSFGSNYLLPVDATLENAADLDLVAIEAQSVMRQMFSARNRTNIFILDACRNNPFTNITEFNDPGLAEMKAPTGTFLAYATAPGAVALDGIEGNSPFTQALAREMVRPGVPIEQMFKSVRVSVLDSTRGKQTPWDTSSLTSDFAFVAERKLTAEELAELQLWTSVQQSKDPVQIMLFLRAYPDGQFEVAARDMLKEAMQNEIAAGNTPKPAPVQTQPSGSEQQAFEAAQAMASIAGYESFLETYPSGIFTEFAQTELTALRQKADKDPDGEGVTPEVVAAAPKPAQVDPQDVTLTSRLLAGPPEIQGKTIADLIKTSPLYPPIEGLPESYWKEQTCSNCHEWTPDALCTQAKVYLNANAERSLNKQHPYGGGLKRALQTWAAGGCR
jgi:uncharacterized caspase-like protein